MQMRVFKRQKKADHFYLQVSLTHKYYSGVPNEREYWNNRTFQLELFLTGGQ